MPGNFPTPIKLSRLDSLRDSPILHRTNLPYIRIPSLDIVRFTFTPGYHISFKGARTLQEQDLLSDHVASRLLARPRQGLWVYYSLHLLNVKPVVRNWHQRRIRSALAEELQKRGFDKDGQRIGNCTGRGAKNDLFGTLEIAASPELTQANGEEVRNQTGLMVEELQQMCERWRKKGNENKKGVRERGELQRRP